MHEHPLDRTVVLALVQSTLEPGVDLAEDFGAGHAHGLVRPGRPLGE
jgi:hypothetical protein